jgi:hypothetical protein
LTLLVLAGASRLQPVSVLAASATLSAATPLYDAPDPNATMLVQLPEGAVVTIEGPPVAGFYPVAAGDVSGWLTGETMLVEKDVDEAVGDAGAGGATSDAAPGDPPTDTPAVGAETSGALDPAGAPEEATDGAVIPDGSQNGGDAPPTDPASQAPAEAVLAATPFDTVASEPVETAAAEAAADSEPVPAGTAPDAGPLGPASVVTEAPILAGPGPEFGLIAMAAAGGAVEQTGHQINGYVTVQYSGITGWAPLDHLGPPLPQAEATDTDEASESATKPVSKKKKKRSD